MLLSKPIPKGWKHSTTTILHNKDNPTIVTNYRSVALACTIYKLFTSAITSLLTTFGENYQIPHHSQEGFHPMRNTARQIQAIIEALEDAKFINKDIFPRYIDFKNAFGLINQLSLFVIMEDLGYPPNAIELVDNIYAESTPSFRGTHFTPSHPYK